MAYSLIGKNFTPPDIHAKVTGRAKYAEDFRAEGMLFCRLLTSPVPHARITSIDTSAAEAMEGVIAVLTADEVPNPAAPAEPILTNEPMFIGQPILAVAAVDETTAQNAIEQIQLEFEELPFTVDPLESLYPGGPDARTDGNIVNPGMDLRRVKWTARDFAAVEAGQLPMGEAALEWSYGDVDAGFAQAARRARRDLRDPGSRRITRLEPRTAMAYWENGKCIVHASSQSQSFPLPGVAEFIGIPPEDLVFIAEFCGGGFGSKGSAYPYVAIPALMSRKAGRPVMMRVSRDEEYFIGSARPGFQGRIRMGFAADGRFTAADLYIVQENGPTSGFNDWRSAADAVSFVYSVPAMRFRGIPITTNTPPRGPQRGPGQNQIAMAIEPLIDKAAAELGIDQFAIRRINATTARDALRRQPERGDERVSTAKRSTKALSLSTGRRARRAAANATAPRYAASVSVRPITRRARAASTVSFASRRTASCTSTPASATSAPTRTRARRASPRRCSSTTGRTASSSAATAANICRGISASSAAIPHSR